MKDDTSTPMDEAREPTAVMAATEAQATTAHEVGAMTRIHSLADRLLTIPDLSMALSEVLDSAIALFNADRGTLQIHDPEDDVLRYAALRGFDTSALDHIPPIDRDFHSTCAVALRTEQRVVASDLYADPQWADHASTAESLGYRAAVSTPLKTRKEEFQGVLTVHFDRARTPTEEELRWADLLARLAAHLIERAHVENALRESEEKYRTLFESIDEGFCLVEYVDDPHRSLDFRFVEVNQAFERQSGLTGVVGKLNSELAPDVADYWKETYAEVARTGVARRMENHHEPTDRWYDVFISRVGGEGSRQICLVFKDTTERKRAEATLRESEERQAFLLKFSDELRAEPDSDAVANRAIGLLMEELQLDRCYITFYRPEDDEADFPYQVGNEGVPPLPEKVRLSDFPEAYAQVLDRTFVIEDDFERRGLSEAERKNSKQLGMRAMVASTVRRGKNNPICSMAAASASARRWTSGEIALVEEVAERTWAAMERARAEAALRENEEKYRSLFESMDEGYLLADVLHDDATGLTDIRFVEANPAAARIAGRDFTGQRMRDIDPDYEDYWYELYGRVASTGEAERAEHYAKPHGRWFEFNVSKVGNGDSRRVAVVFQDVTERKRAEDALRESEEKYRTLFESIDEGFCIADRVPGSRIDFRYVAVNPAFELQTGLVNAVGRTMRDAVPEVKESNLERYARVADGGTSEKFTAFAFNREYQVEALATGQPGQVAMLFRDVTMAKKAEAALRESEARLAGELQNAKALQTMSGLLITEGESGRLFEEIVDTAISIMRADFGSIQLMDPARGELRLIASRNFSPKAEAYWQRVSVKTASTCGSALEHGERVIVENVATDERTRTSDNMAYWQGSGIVAVQSTPLTARDGTIIGMISTHWRVPHLPQEAELRLFDVLARQAADFIERTRAEEALRESERHANMLLAELQHRVRNTLGVIRSIARRTAENSASVEDMVAHFHGRLDAFSRVQVAMTRNTEGRVDLTSIVEDELVAHAARSGEQLHISGPDISLEPKTAERLSLAIHELTTNAVKHGALIDGHGCVRITWAKEANGAGEEFVLHWSESGIEVDTTKPPREGFGMELLRRSLPYDLGGKTKVDLTPGGLRFELRMPFPEQLGHD